MNIFIRKEVYENEFRTPLIPQDIQCLTNFGFHFTIQESDHRIFTNKEYLDISGVQLTKKDWFEPEFQNSFILGIKELSALEKLNHHIHCYFSHSFKQQSNSKQILSAFKNSKSILHDLEYLLDVSGNRLIAFGFHAGLVGATLGLQEFQLIHQGKHLENLQAFQSFESMITSIQSLPILPKIIVLGANGRCGSGVCSVLNTLHIPFTTLNKNDSIPDLYEFDIIFNCILLDPSYSTIWFSKESILNYSGNPIVIVDISCDYSKPNNPIQIYKEATTWRNPVYKPCEKISIIAIENLPSLLPKESSIHFSQQFTKLLLENDETLWLSNKNYFLTQLQNL